MAVVAALAFVINGLRPLSGAEAARIAEQRFQAIPWAKDWTGRYQARPQLAERRDGSLYWVVNFINLESGKPLAQFSLDRRGQIEWETFARPGGPKAFLSYRLHHP
jgi:hypothetical protein